MPALLVQAYMKLQPACLPKRVKSLTSGCIVHVPARKRSEFRVLPVSDWMFLVSQMESEEERLRFMREGEQQETEFTRLNRCP